MADAGYNGIDTKDIEGTNGGLTKLLEQFPGERRKLHERAAGIMFRHVIDLIHSRTVRHTGRLESGQVKVVGTGGGYAAVRPELKVAPHTPFVENGHLIVTGHRKNKDKGWLVDTRLWTDESTSGAHFYRDAPQLAESELRAEVERFTKVLEGMR